MFINSCLMPISITMAAVAVILYVYYEIKRP